MVLILPAAESHVSLVKAYSDEHQIPYITVHSTGFYSYFRVHFPGNFPIVDTHPDETATTDLRLLSPWPELSEFAAKSTRDLEQLNDHEHGHVPYICLLLHYLAKWKKENSSYPTTYKEKTAFRSMVAAGARSAGGEENYDEAVAAVLKTLLPPTLSSSVRAIFDHIPTEVMIQGQSDRHLANDDYRPRESRIFGSLLLLSRNSMPSMASSLYQALYLT